VQVKTHPYGEDPDGGSVPGGFRTWPWSAYALGPKRVADILAAAVVLILFVPIFPLIVLAIKLDSKGPIFFKHRREGRYGRPFHCLKFRSMKTGADQIQETLRTVSEVDGPQFKMADDPRITRVGRFLRETYLDEIPQFLNVLAGHMSVIGPRPSPRAENTLCPYWRYARLSVRPGITGLWQVKRTREPMKDFQEWIYYDTEYVKHLSFWLDMKICWETFVRMLGKFGEQFERR
jgi:lipopolysaccharide/colanic/teichoic acid biosynthesis glycosyltransferase